MFWPVLFAWSDIVLGINSNFQAHQFRVNSKWDFKACIVPAGIVVALRRALNGGLR